MTVIWLSHDCHMTHMMVMWCSMVYVCVFRSSLLLPCYIQYISQLLHKETRTIFSLSLLGTLYLPPSLLQVWLPDDDGAQGDLCLGEESWRLAVCSFAYLLDLPTQAIHNVVDSSDLVGNIFCVNINLRMAQWYCTVCAYCTEHGHVFEQHNY